MRTLSQTELALLDSAVEEFAKQVGWVAGSQADLERFNFDLKRLQGAVAHIKVQQVYLHKTAKLCAKG